METVVTDKIRGETQRLKKHAALHTNVHNNF